MGYWPVVKKVVKDSDIILFILDARMPEMSKNPVLEGMVKKENKELMMVFTKSDLVREGELVRLREKFREAFFVSGTKNLGMKKLKEGIMIRAKKKGLESPYVGVVGYPNVGKSAIINALAKRARAKVSSIAGTTKGIQWINAGSLKILDSPGVVPMKDSELKLGMIGAKNVEKMKKPEQVVFGIIKNIIIKNKNSFERFYNVALEEGDNEYDILVKVGKARGFLVKGGKVDERRTMVQIIRDWQEGKIVV
jgi:ribosome biogenesis GTPase A